MPVGGELHFFPPDIMGARPAIAPLIAEAIAQWAHIECALGVLLAVILETEAQTGLAMLSALTSSSNQMSVVSAAAKAKLTVADEELFSAFMMLVRSAAKHRHKLAHWCWVLSRDLPDDLLLIDPAHQQSIAANMLGFHDPLVTIDRENIFVLRKQDAEEMLATINSVRVLSSRVVSVMWQKDRGKRAEARQKLSSEPEMAEALARLRARRNNQEARPQPLPPDQTA